MFNKSTHCCLNCSTDLKEIELEGLKDLKAVGYGIFFSKSTKIVPMICPNCGHVDFYAEDPTIFNK